MNTDLFGIRDYKIINTHTFRWHFSIMEEFERFFKKFPISRFSLGPKLRRGDARELLEVSGKERLVGKLQFYGYRLQTVIA